MRRLLGFVLVAAIVVGQSPRPAIPSPEQFFGFRIGTDRKVARYDKIVAYLQKVAAGSDRLRFRNLGPTTGGNPLVMLEISSPSTIRNLDHFKNLEQKLYFQGASGGAPTAEQRDLSGFPTTSHPLDIQVILPRSSIGQVSFGCQVKNPHTRSRSKSFAELGLWGLEHDDAIGRRHVSDAVQFVGSEEDRE